ncbi:EAL domain-containing protein [Bradyrhizobium sp. LHD-71]|uniref:EAL domain-containing protein n=1 Tax=Bradyrhizobium sp. LHD-71 TaxID=3072141 RepID=UPI00281099BF|nr:EAL domain-containing protein [Bradyrhizobium sp. LHD-71]MDQ8726757.1 EAL domain-containing protein [Bradyrhizobium sp. LHD-71]
MIRISTIFIAVCMVLIASSLGFALYALADLEPMHAALVALAALTVLILYNAATMRLRERPDLSGQIADLSRGTADLARQVGEFGRRLHAVEGKIASTSGNVERRVDPLREEIAELGNLLKQLAVSVAAHEELLKPELSGLGSPVAKAAPAEPTPPVVPEKVERSAPTERAEIKAESRSAATAGQDRPATVSADDARIVTAVKQAADANRIDLHLQPLVTLPQRKVRYYEAMSRIRDADDNVIAAGDFIEAAERTGAMARIDEAVLLRCVQVLRRLLARSKDVGLFCNISGVTLRDTEVFRRCIDFLDANRALAPSFVLEMKQSTLRSLGPAESEHLAALAERGFRFSIDNVTDLRFEPRELADRSVRFIKVPAALLLDPKRASDIHPSDLADMLGRFGIDLIAERIEDERTVVDLLDYDVRFGQGFLFSPPRPLRTESPTPSGTAAPENQPAPAVPSPSVHARAQGIAALARRAAGPT